MGLVDAIISRIDKLIRERLDAAITSRLASDDARLNALDAVISSRLASGDSRLNYLDASVLSRLASNDSRLNNLNATMASRLASNDSRLNFLDASILSRLAGNDSRLNYLDCSILSRLATNDARLNYLNASIASRREDKGQKAKSHRAQVTTSADMTYTVNGAGVLKTFLWQAVMSDPVAQISYIHIAIDGQAAEQVASPTYDGRTFMGTSVIAASGQIPIDVRFKTSFTITARAQGNNIYLNTLYSLDI